MEENRHLKQSLAALETVTARFGGLEAAEVVQETNVLRQERAELVRTTRSNSEDRRDNYHPSRAALTSS